MANIMRSVYLYSLQQGTLITESWPAGHLADDYIIASSG